MLRIPGRVIAIIVLTPPTLCLIDYFAIVFLGFVLFPIIFTLIVLLAYFGLLLSCVALARPYWLGFLSVLISIGCVVAVASYGYYKCSVGEGKITTTKDAIEFGIAIFLCLMVWIFPIAALAKCWLPLFAGSITFIISGAGFTCYWFFAFGPFLEKAKGNPESVNTAKLLIHSITGGIILPIIVLVSPFFVGFGVKKIMSRGD